MTEPINLAEEMAKLPEPPATSRPPYWDYWRHDLWRNARDRPAESFMDWPCIRHTMLVNHFPMHRQAGYVLSRGSRWLHAVRPPVVGQPMDYYQGLNDVSKNMVNLAYHFCLWEQTTGYKVEELRSIYEFGGGFGAMALLARRLGFKGRYIIQDLPEFSLLQRWFLACHDVEVEYRLDTAPLYVVDLLVAIYSISEVPLEFRDDFFSKVSAGSYLILHSSRFAEHDNDFYFGRLAGQRKLNWLRQQVPDDRPDFYLVGW